MLSDVLEEAQRNQPPQLPPSKDLRRTKFLVRGVATDTLSPLDGAVPTETQSNAPPLPPSLDDLPVPLTYEEAEAEQLEKHTDSAPEYALHTTGTGMDGDPYRYVHLSDGFVVCYTYIYSFSNPDTNLMRTRFPTTICCSML